MPNLTLYLSGIPRIEPDGRAVALERHKALALLAYLAVTGTPHRRDALATLLWPDLDQTHARAALRRTLSSLHIALAGDWLDIHRETIGLPPSPAVRLDVAQFRQLLAQCRAHGHPESDSCADCLPLLAEGVALYRGDFLAGFTLRDAPAFDEWQFFETESLRRELATALERLARGYGERGEYETAVRYARRWLALDSLHEPAHCQLMCLYAWAGQRQAALRQYAECVRLLERELGQPPQPATTELYIAIKENRLPLPSPEETVTMPTPFVWTVGATLYGRYRLENELGRGGMGIVYAAHDSLLDRAVAIKALSETGVGTEGRPRLLREAQAIARLDHPHIVPVYDAGEINDTPFIVMQLVAGKNLRDSGPLPLSQIITLATQLCAALEHAHQRGIIHRDVKPENIVITPKGVAKLMDFGLAHSQSATRLTQEGTLLGTLAYLAPEQIMGQVIDGRTDLYALGIILYELTTGRLPFSEGDMVSLISQHLHAPIEPPRTYRLDLPPALDALIVRLLSKQPDDRPGSAAEVRVALENLQRPMVVPTAVPPTLTAAYATLGRMARGQLVGREQELAEASTLWHRAIAGEGQVLLVSGEPGIGKTRLVRELAGLAQAAGATVLADGCHAEGGPPYAPLAGIIRQTFENRSGPTIPDFILAELLTLAPHLRSYYPHVLPNPPLGPEFEQQRLFDSFITWCKTWAAASPLLLLVEDVHWADSGTLALLRHLARRARQTRLLLVMTYRDTEVSADQTHSLNPFLLDLNRERLAEQIRLPRFTLDQTRLLLSTLLASAGEISAEFLNTLYQETEGNPFFVEEVCKGLVEQGQLYQAGGTWRRADMQRIFIPSSVRGAIMARVERLPAPAQEALRLAAVIGRDFPLALLHQASGLDEDALVTALERAEQAQLIGEIGPAGQLAYTFAHALIPFTLRESVGGLRRQRLHHRVAVVIEVQRPHDFEALAYHFAAAGERDQAIMYSRRAAERAKAIYAYDTAIQHLQTALAWATTDNQNEMRLALLEELADVYRLHGERVEAITLYQEALGLWAEMAGGDKWTAVRLHRKTGETFNRLGKYSEIEPFRVVVPAGLQTALKWIAGERPHPESARLLTTMANYAYWGTFALYGEISSSPMSGEAYARAAVQIAEQFDVPMEQSAALEALANCYSTQGMLREGAHIVEQRLALSGDPRLTDQRERINILSHAGSALCAVGEFAQALSHLLEAERLADEIRDWGQVIYTLNKQIQCYFGLDRWDEILQIEDKRLALEARYGRERIGRMCFQCGVSAYVHGWRGEMDMARAHREEAYQMMAAAIAPEKWLPIHHY